MNNNKQILQKYLEIESLLQKLFNQVNFCTTHCINKPISKFSKFARGDIGCCLGEFYRFAGKVMPKELDILNKSRTEKYGKPQNNEDPIMGFEKPCSYHTKKGCILKDHKGIACITYICTPYKEHLKKKYNIDYDYYEVRDFVESVFIGEVNEHKLEEFKNKVKVWIQNTK